MLLLDRPYCVSAATAHFANVNCLQREIPRTCVGYDTILATSVEEFKVYLKGYIFIMQFYVTRVLTTAQLQLYSRADYTQYYQRRSLQFPKVVSRKAQ